MRRAKTCNCHYIKQRLELQRTFIVLALVWVSWKALYKDYYTSIILQWSLKQPTLQFENHWSSWLTWNSGIFMFDFRPEKPIVSSILSALLQFVLSGSWCPDDGFWLRCSFDKSSWRREPNHSRKLRSVQEKVQVSSTAACHMFTFTHKLSSNSAETRCPENVYTSFTLVLFTLII